MGRCQSALGTARQSGFRERRRFPPYTSLPVSPGGNNFHSRRKNTINKTLIFPSGAENPRLAAGVREGRSMQVYSVMGQCHQITRSKKGRGEQNQVWPAEDAGRSPGAHRLAASSRQPVPGRPPACGPQIEAPPALATRRRVLGRGSEARPGAPGRGGGRRTGPGPLVPGPRVRAGASSLGNTSSSRDSEGVRAPDTARASGPQVLGVRGPGPEPRPRSPGPQLPAPALGPRPSPRRARLRPGPAFRSAPAPRGQTGGGRRGRNFPERGLLLPRNAAVSFCLRSERGNGKGGEAAAGVRCAAPRAAQTP